MDARLGAAVHHYSGGVAGIMFYGAVSCEF